MQIPTLTDRDQWTDDDLDALRIAVLTEQERRQTLDTAASQAEQINQRYVAAIVTHGGKTWESLIPANVWEPGVSGWREVVTEDPDTGDPGVPDFVQPTGAHDAYQIGAHDAYQIGDRVRFDGKVYESLIGGNTWSPSAYPTGWKLIA